MGRGWAGTRPRMPKLVSHPCCHPQSSCQPFHRVHPDTGPNSQSLSPLSSAPSFPQHLSPQALSLQLNSLPFHMLSILTAPSSPTVTPASCMASQPPVSPPRFIVHMALELALNLSCS